MRMTPTPRPLHLISLVLFLFFPSTTSSHGSDSIPCPSSPCEPPRTCDQLNLRCVCPNPRELSYDPVTHKCSIMENVPCGRSASSSSSPYNCTSHTSCTLDGDGVEKCRCSSGYLKDGLGKCALSHGRRCDSVAPHQPSCAARYFLRCSTELKECRCAGEGRDYVWDPNRGKCVSLVGSRCDQSSNEDDDRVECVVNAQCKAGGRCECSPGWSAGPLPGGRGGIGCFVDYGYPCNGTSGRSVITPEDKVPLLCDSSKLLLCRDSGLCGCEFYGQMEWTEDEGCVMLAGEFCDLVADEGVHRCGEGAICAPRRGSNPLKRGQKGLCTCVEGKFPSKTGHCTPLRGHGLDCTLAADCDSASFLTCVIGEDGLGICDCEAHDMAWITGDPGEGSGRCAVLPGRPCSRNLSCSPNSFCDQEFCTCVEGYFLDSEMRECISRSTTPSVLSTSVQLFPNFTTTTTEKEDPIFVEGVAAKGLSREAIPNSSTSLVHSLLILVFILPILLHSF